MKTIIKCIGRLVRAAILSQAAMAVTAAVVVLAGVPKQEAVMLIGLAGVVAFFKAV